MCTYMVRTYIFPLINTPTPRGGDDQPTDFPVSGGGSLAKRIAERASGGRTGCGPTSLTPLSVRIDTVYSVGRMCGKEPSSHENRGVSPRVAHVGAMGMGTFALAVRSAKVGESLQLYGPEARPWGCDICYHLPECAQLVDPPLPDGETPCRSVAPGRPNKFSRESHLPFGRGCPVWVTGIFLHCPAEECPFSPNSRAVFPQYIFRHIVQILRTLCKKEMILLCIA